MLESDGLGCSQHLEVESPAEVLSCVQRARGSVSNSRLQRVGVRGCGFESDGVLFRKSTRRPRSGADPQAQERKSVWIESHYQTLAELFSVKGTPAGSSHAGKKLVRRGSVLGRDDT